MAELGDILAREIIIIDKDRYIGVNCPTQKFKEELRAALESAGYSGFTDFFMVMSRKLIEDVKRKEAEHNGQPTD